MNQEAIAIITRNDFSKLLQSPGRDRMSSDVTIQHATTTNFHNHQDIQPAKTCHDRHQEISCYHSLDVIPHKASPVLPKGSLTILRIGISRPVYSHRSG